MPPRDEVTRWGVRSTQQFSLTVFVAEAAMAESTDQPTQSLDEAPQLAVDAWNNGVQARRARAGQARSATEGLTWDTPGYEPPHELDTLEPRARAAAGADTDTPSESTGTPTRRCMTASVAVGVVPVSRNTGAEMLSSAEHTMIIQEVQEGLVFALQRQADRPGRPAVSQAVGWSGCVALGAPAGSFAGAPAVISRNGTDNQVWQKWRQG